MGKMNSVNFKQMNNKLNTAKYMQGLNAKMVPRVARIIHVHLQLHKRTSPDSPTMVSSGYVSNK